MTEERTVVVKADTDRLKDYLHRQVKAALHAHSDAVRIVTEIGVWVRTQQHLISLCTTEDCADCATRVSLLDSLGSLLPTVGDGSAGGGEDMTEGTRVTRFGGEDGDTAAFGCSDSGNRGGSETGGGREGDRDW